MHFVSCLQHNMLLYACKMKDTCLFFISIFFVVVLSDMEKRRIHTIDEPCLMPTCFLVIGLIEVLYHVLN